MPLDLSSANLQNPITEDGLALHLSEVRLHPVHDVPTLFYRMLEPSTGSEVGRINLRYSSKLRIVRYAGHVGYTVEAAHRGHRYAARALRLLAPVAQMLEMKSIWITCEPHNVASRRACEHAGATLIETIDIPASYVIRRPCNPRSCCRYVMRIDSIKPDAPDAPTPRL